MKPFKFALKIELRGVAMMGSATAFGVDATDARKNLKNALANDIKATLIEEEPEPAPDRKDEKS